MIAYTWTDLHLLFSYVICSLTVLLLGYFYGLCWTLAILFTIYLLDGTLNNYEEEEEILGKPLSLNVKKIHYSIGGGVCEEDCNKRHTMFFSNKRRFKGSNGTKDDKSFDHRKPTLQSLIYAKKSKENIVPYDGQPLVAVVKNNMHLQSSTNIDLDRKKPIYQRMQSPGTLLLKNLSKDSPSVYNRHNRTPIGFYNKQNETLSGSYDKQYGTPKGLYDSPSYSRKNSNSSIIGTSSNDYLEVHGSYFINRSVLHSPTPEKQSFSLVNDNFNTPLRNNGSLDQTDVGDTKGNLEKSTTLSVVEALREKSKRKRTYADSSSECETKKTRIDNDRLETSLDDLIQSSPSVLKTYVAKRKAKPEKEVTSAGVQCLIEEEVEMMRKKARKEENDNTPSKFGLSQKQINELSNDAVTHLSNETKTNSQPWMDGIVEKEFKDNKKEQDLKDGMNENGDDTLKSQFKGNRKKVTMVGTPVKEIANDMRMELKQSALKKIKAPYEKLFDASFQKRLTPASKEKMRKHPVYFTAKIDIDEIQRHREEFGESGVSLRAFRLDQEEAAKRVNDLLGDDGEGVDFQRTSLAGTSDSASTLATSIFSSFSAASSSSSPRSSNTLTANTALFGTTTSAPLIISSNATTNSGFSFATATSNSSLSLTSTGTASSSLATTSTPLPTIQPNLSSQSVSSLSSQVKFGTPGSFSFGTSAEDKGVTTTSLVTPATSFNDKSVNSSASTSSNNFTFGVKQNSEPSSTSITQPSSQLKSAVKAPEVSKVSFSFGVKPTTTQVSTSSSIPASVLSETQFLFGQKPVNNASVVKSFEPTTSLAISTAASVTSTNSGFTFAVHTTSLSSNSSSTFPYSNATRNLFNVTSSNTSLPSLVSSTHTVSTASSTATNQQSSVNLLNQHSYNNIFSASSTTTAISQKAIFPAVAALPSTVSFGQVSSNPSSSLPSSNSFAPANTAAIFSFKSSPLPSTAFNFGASTSQNSAPATAPANIFNSPSVSASSSNIFGQAASTAINVTSSQIIFGITSTSAPTQNIFGAPTATSQSIFGAPATSAQNIFGAPTTSTQSIFGAATTNAQNIFGAVASSAASSQNIFGSAPQNSFGSNSQTTFGPSTQNIFGATQPTQFGDQSKSSSGFSFGAATTTQSGGFSFGTNTTKSIFGPSSNTFGSTAVSNAGGAFGATSNTNQNSSLAPFGSSSNAKAGENPFGQSQASSSGFDFSASLKAPAINFGAPSFGSQPAVGVAKPSFNFGSQPAAPAFGTPTTTPSFGTPAASPAFGNVQQPAFGNALPTPFGTPPLNPPAGGGFTIGAGSSNPPTRQTQRARRRLRR